MMGGPSNPRLAGVRKNTQTPSSTEGGAPRTVLAVEPVEQFAVAFNDEQGRLQRMIVLRVGDRVYVPPGSIEWSASLRPAATWLQDSINRDAGIRMGPQNLNPDELPTDDGVNVLGEEANEEEQDNASPTLG